MLPPRAHDVAVRFAEGLCGMGGGFSGLVLGLLSWEPIIGPEAQVRPSHLALIALPSLAGIFAGFLAGGWLSRRLPARCHCGLRARRVSSSPIVYRCALSHTRTLDVPTPPAPLFDGIRAFLDRPQLVRVERDREREEARANGAQEGSLSLPAPSSDQGAVSIAHEAGAVTFAEKTKT